MFGLPVLTTRRQALRVRPSWKRAAGLVGAAMLLATLGNAQEKANAPASLPPDNKPAAYVGSTTCQMCHEDIFNAFQKNPHAVVETDKKRGWETKACESCHGPGSKHADSASAADIKQRASRTTSTSSAPGATPTFGRASSAPTNTGCLKAPCPAWIATIPTAACCPS